MKIKKKAFTIEEEFQGAVFTVKALTPGDVDRVVDASISRKFEVLPDKTVKHVVENKRGAERLQQALSSITGWTGVTDEDGVEVPFSTDAIAAMLEYVPGFSAFVGTSVDKAIKARNDMEETLTKNS